jgi:predicted DNA-binding protein (MmcQ/YjbR family)
MAKRDESTDPAVAELRAFGLTYPGAHTKSPWPGHLDLAVNDKTFAYLSVAGEPFKLSCKLPHSVEEALSLPFVTPTPYGLGKSGWVTAQLPDGPVPVEMFKSWIDESYRAQAPKRLSARLGAAAAEVAEMPRPAARTAKRAAARATKRALAPSAPRAPAKKRAAKKKSAAKRAPPKKRAEKAPPAQRKRSKRRTTSSARRTG